MDNTRYYSDANINTSLVFQKSRVDENDEKHLIKLMNAVLFLFLFFQSNRETDIVGGIRLILMFASLNASGI